MMNWSTTPRWARHVATVLVGALLVFTAALLRNAVAAPVVVYSCKVLKVTDGDTLVCAMDPAWPEPVSPVRVRVAGIDTPESRKPPARCVKEVRLGKIAKAEMQRRVPVGTFVTLRWTAEPEKYGRLLAYVTLPDGRDWASEMIRLGMARAYGKTNLTKSNWCK